jgi:hypothetical protein
MLNGRGLPVDLMGFLRGGGAAGKVARLSERDQAPFTSVRSGGPAAGWGDI